MLRRQFSIFVGIIVAIFAMTPLVKLIVIIWIGPEVEVPALLIISIGLLFLVSTWNNIFAMFFNGVGEVGLQINTSVVAMVINIPLAILLVR